ncbi:MAG: hypothetical protein ACJ752_14060 [Gaiellaceae bacterium]
MSKTRRIVRLKDALPADAEIEVVLPDSLEAGGDAFTKVIPATGFFTSKVFPSRAIRPITAGARGYLQYAARDYETIRKADPRLLEPEFKHWLRSALQAPGWVMKKYALMPDDPVFGSDPYAQLRPDWPVMARTYGHAHDGMLHRHRDDEKLQRRKGKSRGRCYCGQVHLRPPFKRSEWPLPVGRKAKVTLEWYQPPIPNRDDHEASTCDWAKVPMDIKLPCLILDERPVADDPTLREILVPTGHLHPDTGETILATDKPHTHLSWAKYLYVKGERKAQRLNTHPDVRSSGYAPDPETGLFVFVIEGTLKLDSVVSAGWPGIESGSVTVWDARGTEYVADEVDDDLTIGRAFGVRELERFAERYLQGVPTAVICDSDWAENAMVKAQVDAAVAILAGCGVPAVGCAPPEGEALGWNSPLTGHPKHAKRGIDDWLAEHDEHERHDALLDLVVREDGVDDAPGLPDAVGQASRYSNARQTDAKVLRDLGRRATDAGSLVYRRAHVAKATGVPESTVDDSRDRLLASGALKRLRDLEHHVDDDGWWTRPSELWLPPELRSPPIKRTLRAWLDEAG